MAVSDASTKVHVIDLRCGPPSGALARTYCGEKTHVECTVVDSEGLPRANCEWCIILYLEQTFRTAGLMLERAEVAFSTLVKLAWENNEEPEGGE